MFYFQRISTTTERIVEEVRLLQDSVAKMQGDIERIDVRTEITQRLAEGGLLRMPRDPNVQNLGTTRIGPPQVVPEDRGEHE